MKTHKFDTRRMASLAMLCGILLVMGMTGIGFVPLPLIKATTMHIPVILGAILLGPKAGGILGGLFGFCSIWANTTAPGLMAFAFSPFMSNDGLIGAQKPQNEFGNQKTRHEEDHAGDQRHAHADAGDMADGPGFALAPVLGSDDHNALAHAVDHHLQKELHLIGQSHAGQCALAEIAQHHVIGQIHTEHDQILARDEE